MNGFNVDQLLKIFWELPEKDRAVFLRAVMPTAFKEPHAHIALEQSAEEFLASHKDTTKTGRPCCPHCGSFEVVKNGTHGGKQRFLCRNCEKSIGWNTGSIFNHSKKDMSQWLKFRDCFLEKKTLRDCAKECEISLDTAFKWRHKVLDALSQIHDAIQLDGVVEADETFFALSYKGARKKFFESLNIKPKDRGEPASLRGLSKEKICVPCAVTLNGKSTAAVSCRGKPSFKAIEAALSGKIAKNSTLVTDNHRAYDKLAVVFESLHVPIPRGKRKLGIFNIQLINNYHGQAKRLINGLFRGVATKYLNNYLVYNNFINFAKETLKEKCDIFTSFVFTTKVNTKSHEISKRNPLPLLA